MLEIGVQNFQIPAIYFVQSAGINNKNIVDTIQLICISAATLNSGKTR